MSASDIVANMARGWNRNPAGQIVGSERSGVSAALWTQDGDGAEEVSAEPDTEHHMLCIPLSAYHADMRVDGRRLYEKTVPPGGLQLIRAGERPSAVLYGRFRVLHIYLPDRTLRELVETEAVLARASSLELIDPECGPDRIVEDIGREVLAEMRDGAPLARIRIDTLGQELAIRLIRAHSTFRGLRTDTRTGPSLRLSDRRVRIAIEYLDARVSEDVGLAELAAEVGLSPRQLTSAFTRSTGVPPHRWLVQRRIQLACDLLREPHQSVTEIAFACGFSSSQHFATAFRKQTGRTPSDYRRDRLN